MSRSKYAPKSDVERILASLMPENRLALEISLSTGLRISDVLSIKVDKLSQRMTVREMKTGKNRRVYIPKELYERAVALSGRYYIFEGRLDERRPRTRQAVYKDIRQVAKAFRVPVVPHSMRKIYAVEQYRRCGGDLARVQRLLNHSQEAVTMIYALADQIGKRYSA